MIIIQAIMDSIKISKEYLNFSSAHFLIFNSNERETIHGHNYRVKFTGFVDKLQDDMVFDFLKIKPLIKNICDSLNGKILIAKDNPFISIYQKDSITEIKQGEKLILNVSEKDLILLPIKNISAELLARYISKSIDESLIKNHHFIFKKTIVEVEETKGQSAVFEQERKNS